MKNTAVSSISFSIMLLLAAAAAMAQLPAPAPTVPAQPGSIPCPNVSVQTQGGQMIRDGQRISFVANISGGDGKVTPTIVWNVSAGYITDGQNTPRISVDTTGTSNTPEREIKADLWVGGYDPQCVLQASARVKILPTAVKFGDFGVLPDAQITTNLKKVAADLSQSSDTLWVIVYAGRTSERGFATTWAKKLRDGLVSAGLQSKQIVMMDGGFREEAVFDFWTVPLGAEPPRPAPSVDRREIVYPKTTPPAKKP